MPKPQTCWMIKAAGGWLIFTTAAYTRKRCIENLMVSYGPNWTWKKIYRSGARAVRVHLSEVME